MSHFVLWRLTSQSFCKGTYKVYNLQLFRKKFNFIYECFYISSFASSSNTKLTLILLIAMGRYLL